jgi:hypothetical protein
MGAMILQPVGLLVYRFNRYIDPVIFSFLEFNLSVGESKKRVIPAEPDIESGIMPGASLADDDVASFDCVTAEELHSQPFAL